MLVEMCSNIDKTLSIKMCNPVMLLHQYSWEQFQQILHLLPLHQLQHHWSHVHSDKPPNKE